MTSGTCVMWHVLYIINNGSRELGMGTGRSGRMHNALVNYGNTRLWGP